MKKTTVVSGTLSVLFFMGFLLYDVDILKTLNITFATIWYHFAIRLLIGNLYQRLCNNQISFTHQWFHVGIIEKNLYHALKVKEWKKYVPTYNAEYFDLRLHSYKEVAMAMCQAELVHETIILFSFLPLIASKWVGGFSVFFITSLLAAMVDLAFVILQRFNRPRILKLVK